MTTRILPLRTIIIEACWPQFYQVWEGEQCIATTDTLAEAEAIASETDDDEPRGTTPGCAGFAGNC